MQLAAGAFAGAVFEKDTCVMHKVIKKYTQRKKQGGSQSSKDSKGNAGSQAKSAGAFLRRQNEKKLLEVSFPLFLIFFF